MLTNLEKEGKHSRRLEISSVARSRSKNCVQSTCSLRNEPAIPVICWSSKSDTNLVFLLTTICILSKASTMSRFVSRYFLKSAGTNRPTFLYPDSVVVWKNSVFRYQYSILTLRRAIIIYITYHVCQRNHSSVLLGQYLGIYSTLQALYVLVELEQH